LCRASFADPPKEIEWFMFVILVPVVFLLALVKMAVSLKGISLLKKDSFFSPLQRVVFIAGYVNNFILTGLVAFFCLFSIDAHYFMLDDEGWEPTPWFDYKRVLPDLCMLMMLVCCLYFAFNDIKILKDSRRRANLNNNCETPHN
jgi:hypothetical protein